MLQGTSRAVFNTILYYHKPSNFTTFFKKHCINTRRLLPITRKNLAAITITQLEAAPTTSYIFLVTGKRVHPAGGHGCLKAVQKIKGRVETPPAKSINTAPGAYGQPFRTPPLGSCPAPHHLREGASCFFTVPAPVAVLVPVAKPSRGPSAVSSCQRLFAGEKMISLYISAVRRAILSQE